jgi:hypothetical protein
VATTVTRAVCGADSPARVPLSSIKVIAIVTPH